MPPLQTCRHIRTNGRRCNAIAVRDRAFCYYHGAVNERHRILHERKVPLPLPTGVGIEYIVKDPVVAEHYGLSPRQSLVLDFPALEDSESVGIALSLMLQALGKNHIDPARARTMLYTLQLATLNMRSIEPPDNLSIQDVVPTPEGREIAPPDEPTPPAENG
jgi:hypothetical protein